MTYIFERLDEFGTAQHFTDKAAYYGIRLQEERQRGRGRHQVTEIKDALVFVSSERELLPADAEVLRTRGFYSQAFPAPPPPRFSPRRVQAWIEGHADCPDPCQLFHTIRAAFLDRIEYPDEAQADVVALFTIGTYLHRDFDAYPYLALFGSKASGKTKNGKIISELAFNAVEAVTLTGGALYLEVEAHAATLLLDDREDLAGEEARAINAMLNAGYKRGGATIRGSWDTQSAKRFGIYSPKVLTSIRGVNPVLSSRCIVIEMQPSADRAKRKRSEDTGAAFWQVVRDDLYTWGLSEFQAVRTAYVGADPEEVRVVVEAPDGPVEESLEELSGRAWELWRPIVALADYFGRHGVDGLLDRVARYALESTRGLAREEIDSLEGQVLAYLLTLPRDGDGLIRFEPPQIADDLHHEIGERIKPQKLGIMLKRLGLRRYHRQSPRPRHYLVPPEAIFDAARRRDIDLPDTGGWEAPATARPLGPAAATMATSADSAGPVTTERLQELLGAEVIQGDDDD